MHGNTKNLSEKLRAKFSVTTCGYLALVFCLVMVGKLACRCDAQSCASGSLVLMAGSTMPDWSAGEGQTK